jgi:FlaA1/EpsC-like NDP-sugar epimerase
MEVGAAARLLLGGSPLPEHPKSAVEFVAHRTVLITGAGGSIGSELARQVHSLSPGRLILLDRDESLLQAMELELHGRGLLDTDDLVLACIRDKDQLRRVFDNAAPEVVLHAAALKHLPMLERQPHEAVLTNVLGTRNVLVAAREAGVVSFVNISTDKAADPTSVLGASKRVAEMLTSDLSDKFKQACSVRFGNVLGSRGSFLPLLKNRIENGAPVHLTHPQVRRFFMSIPEAAHLVIAAGSMSTSGDVFVLDMGSPMLIRDLIRRYAALVGVSEPEIVITGLRPGEKLEEVVFSSAERRLPTTHARITRTLAGETPWDFASTMREFENVYQLSEEEVVAVFARLVSNYAPQPRRNTVILDEAVRGVSA